ncbi:DUF202 domain-containing protein [Gordonia sputi]|uniref:DUF202 domain-containing protein n=1 Tax=Gordonia sputi TaxID=36823 RepID=UPI002043D40D|nr:DUF202 domain-containing protein [Gordonia sputi]MCM3897660.1 DUF202 domain-containing protein [Gordonia sputi]
MSDRSDPATRAGLQPQRTDLAWSRTSFAILVNGLLVAGREVLRPSSSPLIYALCAVAAVASVVVAIIGRRRRRVLGDNSAPLHRSDTAAVMTTAAAVLTTIVVLLTAALV